MRRLTLAVAWLSVCALAAPGAPIAEEVLVPAGPDDDQQQTTAPVTPAAPPPATDPPPPAASATPSQPVAEPPPPEQSPALDSAADGSADGDTRDRPLAFAATPGMVTIRDFSFGPASVTVEVGESVTWNNSGPSTHSATAGDGSFDTGLLARGESGSATFDEAGTFSYICTPHPSMKATVRVVAQASGDDGGADDGSSGAADAGDTAAPSTGSGSESSGEQLADTGAEPLWLLVTGAGLLLIGASGIRRGSRRGGF
jgi:plastocyanin